MGSGFFKANHLATRDEISDFIQNTLGAKDAHSRLETPFSDSCKQMFNLALEKKINHADKFVYTNHILLGILGLPDLASSNTILKPICDSPQLLSRLESLSEAEKECEMKIKRTYRSRDEVLNYVIKLAKSDPRWESKAAVDLAFLKISPDEIRKRIEGGE